MKVLPGLTAQRCQIAADAQEDIVKDKRQDSVCFVVAFWLNLATQNDPQAWQTPFGRGPNL